MQVNVIITSITTAGKKRTQTVSYVNTAVANNKLLQMAQLLNTFTTDTFVMATKETKGEVL